MVQELDGNLCHDLHHGEEIEVTVEDKPIKVRLQGGLTQETYFQEAKGYSQRIHQMKVVKV